MLINRRFKAWLKGWLRAFLGIDYLTCEFSRLSHDLDSLNHWIGESDTITAVAVDLHMRRDSESLIIVCSKLKGGTIRFIPVEFRDVRTLLDVVRSLQDRFSPRTFYFDGPLALTREIDRELNRARRSSGPKVDDYHRVEFPG